MSIPPWFYAQLFQALLPKHRCCEAIHRILRDSNAWCTSPSLDWFYLSLWQLVMISFSMWSFHKEYRVRQMLFPMRLRVSGCLHICFAWWWNFKLSDVSLTLPDMRVFEMIWRMGNRSLGIPTYIYSIFPSQCSLNHSNLLFSFLTVLQLAWFIFNYTLIHLFNYFDSTIHISRCVPQQQVWFWPSAPCWQFRQLQWIRLPMSLVQFLLLSQEQRSGLLLVILVTMRRVMRLMQMETWSNVVSSLSQIPHTSVTTNSFIDTGYDAEGNEIDANGNLIERGA